jgi:hypothetical protein
MWWYGHVKIEQGEFEEVHFLVKKLSELWETYDYELARIFQYQHEIDLLMTSRKLDEAKLKADEAIRFTRQRGMIENRIHILGGKAITQILLNDFRGAKESLAQAKELISKQELMPTCFITTCLLGNFFYDVRLLEEATLSGDKSNAAKHIKKACKSRKGATKNFSKYAVRRTAFIRLMGILCWLRGNQNRAIMWWERSIEEGRQLGARPDLARTYMEIGKRFLEEKSKYKELNGISTKEYLEKARAMFQEMDLQWDLDELDRIASDS